MIYDELLTISESIGVGSWMKKLDSVSSGFLLYQGPTSGVGRREGQKQRETVVMVRARRYVGRQAIIIRTIIGSTFLFNLCCRAIGSESTKT